LSPRVEAVERSLAVAHKWLFYAAQNAESLSRDKIYEDISTLLDQVTALQDRLLKI
jgi:hypothetical protein